MAMENSPFEDAWPIENGDFPLPCWFWGRNLQYIFALTSKKGIDVKKFFEIQFPFCPKFSVGHTKMMGQRGILLKYTP